MQLGQIKIDQIIFKLFFILILVAYPVELLFRAIGNRLLLDDAKLLKMNECIFENLIILILELIFHSIQVFDGKSVYDTIFRLTLNSKNPFKF